MPSQIKLAGQFEFELKRISARVSKANSRLAFKQTKLLQTSHFDIGYHPPLHHRTPWTSILSCDFFLFWLTIITIIIMISPVSVSIPTNSEKNVQNFVSIGYVRKCRNTRTSLALIINLRFKRRTTDLSTLTNQHRALFGVFVVWQEVGLYIKC